VTIPELILNNSWPSGGLVWRDDTAGKGLYIYPDDLYSNDELVLKVAAPDLLGTPIGLRVVEDIAVLDAYANYTQQCRSLFFPEYRRVG
jgi:hypothetical protein